MNWKSTSTTEPCQFATLSLARRAMVSDHLLHPELTCTSSGNARQLKSRHPFVPRRKTTYQFIWRLQHACGTVDRSTMEGGVIGKDYETPYLCPWHRHPPSWNSSAKKSVVPAYPPQHWCRTFPLLLSQIGYMAHSAVWECGAENRLWPCCSSLSSPSTFPWSTCRDCAGQWDNRMTAQHLPRDQVRPNSGLKELTQTMKKIKWCIF